jgi:acetylornithine deacetylase
VSTPFLTSDDPVELLVRLVEKPSVSGSEGPVVGFIEGQLARWGLEPIVSGRNVWCLVDGKRGEGSTLLLESHIDTVPASDAWTVDPWRPKRADGRVQGLGANDTKGGTAGMMCALRRIAADRDFAGTLLFAATCDEETGGEGLEVLKHELPPFDACVISEPTTLRVASAQRGFMRVVVTCVGQSAHASRPWQGVNAIELAMEDFRALREIATPEEDSLLGRATCTPTLIEGGVKSNVVPPSCTYTLDIRPTPPYPNDWWKARIEQTVKGRIDLMRGRITPVHTPDDHPIVVAALRATGQAAPIAFGGVSNLYFAQPAAGIVLGPGLPEQSHQADEWIEEEQVRRAVDVYEAVAREVLS